MAYSNVWILLKLLLVMPATNATSERSFSALRRIKTYLRTTMTQVRLNSIMVLHIHSDKTDSLNLYSIGDQFVGSRENRLRVWENWYKYLENLCNYFSIFVQFCVL